MANLGAALAHQLDTEVVACDLALESGHLALMLDARPTHTIDELITRYESSFELDVLIAYLSSTQYRVRLLAAPASPASAPLVTVDGVRAAIEQLRTRFPYVLLDLAPTFSDINLAAMEMADLVLLVTVPEMAGVRATAAALEILDSLGYPPERSQVLVNTVFAAKPLAASDLASALERPVSLSIPYDRNAFVDALNRGIPVVKSSPRSPAARAFTELAQELAEGSGSRSGARAPATTAV